MLRAAGIQVETGILRDRALRLNEAFIKYITSGHPFVTLKTASTLDGKIIDGISAAVAVMIAIFRAKQLIPGMQQRNSLGEQHNAETCSRVLKASRM